MQGEEGGRGTREVGGSIPEFNMLPGGPAAEEKTMAASGCSEPGCITMGNGGEM